MKTKEMIKKTDKELEQMIIEAKKDLTLMNLDYRLKEVKNLKQIKLLKKNIARLLTVKQLKAISVQEKKNG
ncbi:MAG: 50S ribosomal protein L29 [bacterium]|nr:50S ribosomal protein L29 [bacterium]